MCTKQQSNRMRAALFFPTSAHQPQIPQGWVSGSAWRHFQGNSFEGEYTKSNLLRNSGSDKHFFHPFHRFCLCFHHFPGIVVSSVTKLSNHKTASIIIVTLWRLETGMFKLLVDSERQTDNVTYQAALSW